jgi:HD superfamily phosphohydrolase YqeK
MYSSVQVGVSALPAETEAFFLLPVDIALVRSWSIQQTADCYQKHNPLVAYPTFQGQRGHPPLISFDLKEAIDEHNGHGGLRNVLLNYDQKALEVTTFDRNILLDMDHPEDFASAENQALTMSRLDRDEAWTLVQRVHPISKAGLAHGHAVAMTAEALAKALNRAGCCVDVELSYVCGLVHDMAKGQPKHEEAGGKLLDSMGLTEMAPIVAAHRDLTLAEDQHITAKEVVYLADKLTRGPQRVKVRDRFQEKLDLFSKDPEAVAAITRRLSNAMDLKRRMEKILGSPVESVVPQRIKADNLDQA